MYIDPTGGQYTIEWLRMCARSTVRVTRSVCAKHRRVWLLFTAMTAMIIVTSTAIAGYSTEYVRQLFWCNPYVCSTSEMQQNQHQANFIGWACVIMIWTIATALILTLTTALKLHVDIVWSIPTRKWVMRHKPHVSYTKLHERLENLLRTTFWYVLYAGILATAAMLALVFTSL